MLQESGCITLLTCLFNTINTHLNIYVIYVSFLLYFFLQTLADIRDRIDIVYTPDYPNFLKRLFHSFHHVMTTIPAFLTAAGAKKTSAVAGSSGAATNTNDDNMDSSIRLHVLTIYAAMPVNDALQPFVSDLYTIAFDAFCT